MALSKERFQFIFKHEHDLLDILNRGVHTFDNWSIVLERWVEKPPEDHLQYLMVWLQMRNITINHYTPGTISSLGDFAGQVVDVPFDPEKAQYKDYVRVLVKFDVSKPLRRSKKLTLPSGEVVNILYDYERLQKRCYTCQRLTHEQSHCPFVVKSKQGGAKGEESSAESKRTKLIERLAESDPLFGVLPDNEVGRDPASGRPKIAEEVLQGMRQYLLAAEGQEMLAREDRVRKSISDLMDDPIGQKTFLRLEPALIISKALDKGKGVVYDFSAQKEQVVNTEKLMASAISAGMKVLQSGKIVSEHPISEMAVNSTPSKFLPEGSTGYSVGFYETRTSGTSLKKPKSRTRPDTYKRKGNKKRIQK